MSHVHTHIVSHTDVSTTDSGVLRRRVQVNYTTARSPNPDLLVTSTNCALGQELKKLYEHDQEGQLERNQLTWARNNLSQAQVGLQLLQRTLDGISVLTPPANPPPPPPNPPPAGGAYPPAPPSDPATVTNAERLRYYENRVEALQLEVKTRAAAISACIPSETQTCGRSSVLAPNPWLSRDGRECMGYSTYEALEGAYCGFWSSQVNVLAAESEEAAELLTPDGAPYCFSNTGTVLKCTVQADRTNRAGVYELQEWLRPDRKSPHPITMHTIHVHVHAIQKRASQATIVQATFLSSSSSTTPRRPRPCAARRSSSASARARPSCVRRASRRASTRWRAPSPPRFAAWRPSAIWASCTSCILPMLANSRARCTAPYARTTTLRCVSRAPRLVPARAHTHAPRAGSREARQAPVVHRALQPHGSRAERQYAAPRIPYSVVFTPRCPTRQVSHADANTGASRRPSSSPGSARTATPCRARGTWFRVRRTRTACRAGVTRSPGVYTQRALARMPTHCCLHVRTDNTTAARRYMFCTTP